MNNNSDATPSKWAKKVSRTHELEEVLRKRFADLAMATGMGPKDPLPLAQNHHQEKLDAGRIALGSYSFCAIQTNCLMVHGLPANITLAEYATLNSIIGLRLQTWTPNIQTLWESGLWKALGSLETIKGSPTLLCSVIVELEEFRLFAVAGEEGDYSPRIFKIPWEGSPKSLLVQAVPQDFREFLQVVPEALASRGFPDDDAGEATMAVYGLLTSYLEATAPRIELFTF